MARRINDLHAIRTGLLESSSNQYFSREQIDQHSPSRLDGMDFKEEANCRMSCCLFLGDLGVRLKVPQYTIATAIVLCHRFYLRQSLVKNDRFTVATSSMFLAGKMESTPIPLLHVVMKAYEIQHEDDSDAGREVAWRLPIITKSVYNEQRKLVLTGERLILVTLGFDLNIDHPYEPLAAAIKRFKVREPLLPQVAWNFVNDGLHTTLCLQFKAQHIAAAAIFLAAKFLKVKLSTEGWWQEFEIYPQELQEIINQIMELYESTRDRG